MLAGVADRLFEQRTDDEHAFGVKLVLEVAAVEAALAQADEEQEFAFELYSLFG